MSQWLPSPLQCVFGFEKSSADHNCASVAMYAVYEARADIDLALNIGWAMRCKALASRWRKARIRHITG